MLTAEKMKLRKKVSERKKIKSRKRDKKRRKFVITLLHKDMIKERRKRKSKEEKIKMVTDRWTNILILIFQN